MNRIKEFRTQNHLTQKQLVVELKKKGIAISQDSISKYEKGDRNPTEAKWNQLAKFFNTNVDTLKGVGLNQTEIVNKIISTIHYNFFAENQKTKKNVQKTNILTFVIQTYLNLTNQDKVPLSFYKDNQKHNLNNNIKEFWKGCFKEITNDLSFINSLIGINDQEIFDSKLIQKISMLISNILNPTLTNKLSVFNLSITFTKNGLEIVDDLEETLGIKDVRVFDSEGKDVTKKLITIQNTFDKDDFIS